MLNILFTILLLEGFVTISVEVLTIRQLLPFYGGSVLITSIIIGVFLLFLALGYWRGGSYQQDFFKELKRNFACSMLFIGIGLSYVFIAGFYYFSIYKADLPFLLSLSLYLLLVLAPIVYWLGQTIPITTNLFNQQQRISHISGRALFLSTIGSFLGALLTSLLLFQYLGVALTVVINCGLLFLLMVSLRSYNGSTMLSLLPFLLALIFIWFLNVNVESTQFKRTNNYGNYKVIDTGELGKLFQINESSSSLLAADKKAFPYIEYIRHLLFNELKLRHKKILVIGAGGFTLTAAGNHDNKVTYVDIDPAIKDLAEQYFLNASVRGKFVGQDARRYLQQKTEIFDVIISDVYSHQATIPPSLLTAEYFAAIRQHLAPQGLMIANIIANPLFHDEYAQTVFNTIHAVFPYCAIVPFNWQYPLTNMLYICPNVAASDTIYRDDLNRATTDFFKSRQH
ncbi:fused MFS/spermidine synthase [Legionella sp. 27cVA30]|uniref:fused MFS/spermidine synthase n=1 Tax=Legionella TaxID=445 RepID=UPI000F8F06D2|nr:MULTISPECIES: fused MFS/spermidine synthase [Legionella]MCP0914952.1 fused MFS/spermidine synthase [Legionella sp. 27cVA30]RUR16344.1 methyltransferase domain-containing protein [Legionella septentrionalis]